MELTEVLNRLESIEFDVIRKISETTGTRREEACLDHEALLIATEFFLKGANNV